MDPYAHARKKPRGDLMENGGFRSQDPTSRPFKPFDSTAERESRSGLGSKSMACTKFFSTSGCPFGEGCHFLHCVPGGVNAVQQMNNAAGPVGIASKKASGYLPPEQQVSATNFKTRLCSNFATPEGCRFGNKCHFAHGEKELGKSTTFGQEMRDERFPGPYGNRVLPGSGLDGKLGRPAYREPTPPGLAAAAKFGASASANIPVDASLVGAIIGKSGVNSKHICRVTGVKLAIKDDENDTKQKIIELVGSFDQIQEASAMVKQLIMHTTSAAAPKQQPAFNTNNFKTKLCENFAQGTCTFGDHCHFAHGANELRQSQKKA